MPRAPDPHPLKTRRMTATALRSRTRLTTVALAAASALTALTALTALAALGGCGGGTRGAAPPTAVGADRVTSDDVQGIIAVLAADSL